MTTSRQNNRSRQYAKTEKVDRGAFKRQIEHVGRMNAKLERAREIIVQLIQTQQAQAQQLQQARDAIIDLRQRVEALESA